MPVLRGDLPSLLRELRERSVLTLSAAPPGTAGFLDEVTGAFPRRWACAVGPEGPVTCGAVGDACEWCVAVRTALPECPIGASITASVLLVCCAEREPPLDGA